MNLFIPKFNRNISSKALMLILPCLGFQAWAANPAAVTVGAGSESLIVEMTGDAYQGNPQFTLSFDGKQLGGTQTVSASRSANQQQEFIFKGNFAAGSHKVVISFINDAYAGKGKDRNLYLSSMNYEGTVVAGAKASLLNKSSVTFNVASSVTGTTVPTLTVSRPSQASLTKALDTNYTITYNGANLITLGVPDISLITTGDASCRIDSVTGSATNTRTVTLSHCVGEGTVGISIAEDSASNVKGPANAAKSATAINVNIPHYGKYYYLDPVVGDDSYDGLANTHVSGTHGPLRTPARANTLMGAGDTVIFNDGTYNVTRINITKSGADWTHLSTWRCAHDKKCLIRGTDGGIGYNASHIQIGVQNGGFDIEAPNFDSAGISKTGAALFDVHFSYNYIHDCGGAGLQVGRTDYAYADHNVIARNSRAEHDAESGITFGLMQTYTGGGAPAGPHAIIEDNVIYANYNCQQDETWNAKTTYKSGQKVFALDPSVIPSNAGENNYSWVATAAANNLNRAPNSANTTYWKRIAMACMANPTDGNGVIIDTNSLLNFKGNILIQNNIIFKNGARGVLAFKSANVTVKNNTVYSNLQDPYVSGRTNGEAEISASTSSGYLAYDNIAYETVSEASNAAYDGALNDSDPANSGDAFNWNLAYALSRSLTRYISPQGSAVINQQGGSMGANNIESRDPLFTNVESLNMATYISPKQAADAFTLKSGSPGLCVAGGAQAATCDFFGRCTGKTQVKRDLGAVGSECIAGSSN